MYLQRAEADTAELEQRFKKKRCEVWSNIVQVGWVHVKTGDSTLFQVKITKHTRAQILFTKSYQGS